MSIRPSPPHLSWLIIFILGLLAACSNTTQSPTPLAAVNTPSATATLTLTAVPSHTPTPSNTPTPTNTATPTPTPTATAVPLTVVGNPRSLQLAEPQPNGRAPCGFVDVFDFPIDPPHAANVSRGGGDFGVFRSRFDKFHAGEDWGAPSGQSNLGAPVYSIGHGLVTYAQPLGWGRDKGVVIIQHTFADGRTALSFYGHLDPEDFFLEPGSCVQRGQLVGLIGQPRGFPHLHFEVRTQAPYQTLTGYWPEDPTTQGWLWPSQEIWVARVRATPGVSWVRPFANPGSQPIGQISDTDFLILEAGQLLRLNLADGHTNPIEFAVENVDAALLHPTSNQLFIAEQSSDSLIAYSLPNLIQQWQTTVPFNHTVRLLPLPDGNVLVATHSTLTAVSSKGETLWELPLERQLLDWQLTADALFVTIDGNNGRLWRITTDEAIPIADLSGKLAATEQTLWLYARDSLHQIDITNEDYPSSLIYTLPTAPISRGDLVVLPDGGLLLAHADSADRRLIQFSSDGRIQWQRSYAGQIEGNATLHLVNGQPFLAASIGSGANGRLNIYALDPTQQSLTRLFEGGSRTPIGNEMWLTAVANNQLLVNVGGGPLALFDTAVALEASNQ